MHGKPSRWSLERYPLPHVSPRLSDPAGKKGVTLVVGADVREVRWQFGDGDCHPCVVLLFVGVGRGRRSFSCACVSVWSSVDCGCCQASTVASCAWCPYLDLCFPSPPIIVRVARCPALTKAFSDGTPSPIEQGVRARVVPPYIHTHRGRKGGGSACVHVTPVLCISSLSPSPPFPPPPLTYLSCICGCGCVAIRRRGVSADTRVVHV